MIVLIELTLIVMSFVSEDNVLLMVFIFYITYFRTMASLVVIGAHRH